MSKSYSVTSAGVHPAEDRARRERIYYIAMSLRVVCVLSLFWVRGWGIAIALAGAALLPWFAVMVGNAAANGGGEAPEAPEPLALDAPPEPTSKSDDPAGDVIIVDVDPERRSSQTPGTATPGGEIE